VTQPFSYEGLRVVVTGGARGVGAALLDVLDELDAKHVMVIDLNTPSGPHGVFLATDLSDEHAVREVVTRIDGPVHVLFNNAGVADTPPPNKIVDWNIREMTGRAISPREVATVLAFLGALAASYVNGVNLDMDGGFNAALSTGQLDMSGRA
jgi:NAD(P)-dependent dehydrogenase (short-subunit alcohol dehydrogenase family)